MAVRVDTGVYEGGEISMFYDSMIAKLIVHGSTRDQAIARMRDALNAFVIRGVASNIAFQAALMQHPRFVSGNFNTGLIAEEYPKGFNAVDVPHDDPAMLIAVAAAMHRQYLARNATISGQMPGHEYKPGAEFVVRLEDGTDHEVTSAGSGGRLGCHLCRRSLRNPQRLAVRALALSGHAEQRAVLHAGRAARPEVPPVPLGHAGRPAW